MFWIGWMISGTGMAVSWKTSRMEMEQRMRVALVSKTVQEGEALRMIGDGWVVKVFLEVEVRGVEGVLWDGHESLLAEVQECASLLLVCRCTVRRQSEKPAQEETQPGADKQRVSPFLLLFFFTWGSDHSPLRSPCCQKPHSAYSVWT